MNRSPQELTSHLSWNQLLEKGAIAVALLGVLQPTAAKGAEIYVGPTGKLQAALDSAMPGDTIILQAGATYEGNFILRKKAGASLRNRITIKSSDAASLPNSFQRIDPRLDAAYMARLTTPNVNPVLRTEDGASHYIIRGLEFTTTPGRNIYVYDMVRIGPLNATSVSQLGTDFDLNHLWIHGDAVAGGKRGLVMHASSVGLRNSRISGFFASGQETQAVVCWAGRGPYALTNNYLEASGIPALFGGAAPAIQGLTPANVEVIGNHFARPMAWKGLYAVKNLFEIKHGRNFTIRHNLFENNWSSAQDGYGIVLTVRTCESGNYPWSVVQNIDFRENVIRNTEQGVTILGQDYYRAPCAIAGSGTVTATGTTVYGSGTKFMTELKPTDRIVVGSVTQIVKSILSDVSLEVEKPYTTPVSVPTGFKKYEAYAGQLSSVKIQGNAFEGIIRNAFQLTTAAKNVTFANNTAVSTASSFNAFVVGDGPPSLGFVFIDNVVNHGRYGAVGTGTSPGNSSLTKYFPDAKVSKNVIVAAGTNAKNLPSDNFFPPDMATAGSGSPDLSGFSTSPMYQGTDGKTPGASNAVLDQVRQLVPLGRSVRHLARQ